MSVSVSPWHLSCLPLITQCMPQEKMADYIAGSWMSAVASTAKSSWNPGVVVHTAVLALGRVKPDGKSEASPGHTEDSLNICF